MWLWVTLMVEKTKVGKICVSQLFKRKIFKFISEVIHVLKFKKIHSIKQQNFKLFILSNPETKSSQMLEITRSFVR